MKPEESEAQAGRAATRQMAETNQEKGGGLPLFDGTSATTPYRTWERLVRMETLLEDEDKPVFRKALRSLRGAPLDRATQGVTAKTTASTLAIRTTQDILDVLGPVYGGDNAMSREDARVQLNRCRQGKKSLDEFLNEITRLGAQAGVEADNMTSYVKAGVEGRLALVAATSFGDEFETLCLRLRAADRVAPRAPMLKKQQDKTRGRGTGGIEKRECYLCHKRGHIKPDCPDNPGKTRVKGRKTKKDADEEPAEEEDDTSSLVSYAGKD
jgi:hypothetical protein